MACCCPHYDGEKDRRPSVHEFINDKKIESCIAVEDESAVHYKNNEFYKSISFGKDKNSYIVKNDGKKIVENPIDKIDIY